MSSPSAVSSMASPPRGFQPTRLTVQPTASNPGALAGTLMLPCLTARSKASPMGDASATSPAPTTQSCASPLPRRCTANSLPSGQAPVHTTTALFVSFEIVEFAEGRLLTTPPVLDPAL